jgi:cell division protein FtsL
MTDYLCHDFKTPRTDTARRLPSTFRFIPIIFYVALVGSAYMMTMDYFAFQKAKRQKVEADERKSRIESERDALNAEFAELEAESKKAEAVAQWMEGARNIQPIVVKVARAVAAETRLGTLSLERDEDVAANLALGLKVSGANATSEIVNIENALGQLQYRSLSPQQTKIEDTIEYHSTIVRSVQ